MTLVANRHVAHTNLFQLASTDAVISRRASFTPTIKNGSLRVMHCARFTFIDYFGFLRRTAEQRQEMVIFSILAFNIVI